MICYTEDTGEYQELVPSGGLGKGAEGFVPERKNMRLDSAAAFLVTSTTRRIVLSNTRRHRVGGPSTGCVIVSDPRKKRMARRKEKLAELEASRETHKWILSSQDTMTAKHYLLSNPVK